MTDKITPIGKDRRLSDIIREVKLAGVERQDVVVDMKEADRARLELLADRLQAVIDEIPEEVEFFDFFLSSGPQPRLWIDAVAHVHMGPDRRTYRFVRDTRFARVQLAETSRAEDMAAEVSRYVAERLVERERLLEGDAEALRDYFARRDKVADPSGEGKPVAAGAEGQADLPAIQLAETRAAPSSGTFGVLWFLLGLMIGGLVLVAAFWDRISGSLN